VRSILASYTNLIEYENTPIKVVATTKVPKIETPGITIDEVEERKEFVLPYWIAEILFEAGMVKLAEEGVTNDEWTQVHFKERFNPTGPLSVLPASFYSRAYISLDQASKNIEDSKAKQDQLNRIQARYRDILESRIGKLARMAAAEASSTPKTLQSEETRLFEELESFIKQWREEMRTLGAK
jgi:hypothetical protein